MTARHRLVRVPASSANLGPGYDAMGAAMSMHLELEVEETGEFSLDPGGLEVSRGRDNLIVRAFETLHPADGIAFRLRSERKICYAPACRSMSASTPSRLPKLPSRPVPPAEGALRRCHDGVEALSIKA